MKVGDRVGHIRIEELIGSGGMGEVYAGFDERLLRRVAVKTLAAELRVTNSAKVRFLREARLLSKLDHPNICRVYDLVEHEEGDCLVLEMVDGVDLSEWIATGPSREERLGVARGIAEALAAAHHEGIVHRDLKPQNVKIADPGRVKVLDFGIARLLDRQAEMDGWLSPGDLSAPGAAGPAPQPGGEAAGEGAEGHPSPPEPEVEERTGVWDGSQHQVTELGMIVGTPAYMSPEQARGEGLTQASDLFSLGILLQEMFTGESAYDPAATPAARLLQVAEGASRPVEGIDPEVARLIEELKAADPSARPTADQVIARIDWILDRPKRRRRRRFAAATVTAVLALLALAVGASLKLARPKPLLLPGQAGRVLVLPFVNETGEAADDWVRHGLMELVSRTLDGSRGVSVVPPDQVSRALEARGLRVDAGLEKKKVFEILRSLGAELVLEVHLERDGERYRFRYTTSNVAGSRGSRTLEAPTLTAGANLLARRIARRLRPGAPAVEVYDQFSDQPFVNQLYAMGVEALHVSGPAGARPYFEVALDRDPEMHWARIRLAECLENLGRSQESRELALAVLAAARSTHRPDLERAALLQLAFQARRKGQYGIARGYYEASLALARKEQDRAGMADALRGLGVVAYFVGELDLAEKRYQEAIELYRELGDRTGEMYCLGNLSAVADARGDVKAAEAMDTQALAIARATGNLAGVADYLNNLGVSARYQGEFGRARELYRESLELQHRLGNRLGEANALHNLGDMAREQGRLAEAEKYERRALAIFLELQNTNGIGRASVNLAEALLLQGRAEEASEAIGRARAWRAGDPVVLALQALQAYTQGRYGEAVRLQKRAKARAGAGWHRSQEARLETYQRCLREGRRIPLPTGLP